MWRNRIIPRVRKLGRSYFIGIPEWPLMSKPIKHDNDNPKFEVVT